MDLNIIDKKVKYEQALKAVAKKYTNIEYVTSISVLDLNKDIIGFFYDTIEKDYSCEEACLRLYGLLQALFVSIDAIYTLSISLTGSKNFININSNQTLRELKYIRNDVVGHPTNRVINSKTVYCILNPKDIEKYTFKYRIYGLEKEEERVVSFLSIISDYYSEASKLINVLVNYEDIKSTKLFSDDLRFIIKEYIEGHDVSQLFKNFKIEYKKLNKADSRIERRILLLSKIHSLKKSKLNEFTYLYHLRYLYTIMCIDENAKILDIDIKPIPQELEELIKVTQKEKVLKSDLFDLTNHNNPLFNQILNRFINVLKKYNYKNALNFLIDIRNLVSCKNYDIAFAYESIIKEII